MIKEKLKCLIARLEASAGSDRDLDADLFEATGGCAHRGKIEFYAIDHGETLDQGVRCLRCGEDVSHARVPNLTGSIDEAMEWCGRVLPYHARSLIEWTLTDGRVWSAELRDGGIRTDINYPSIHKQHPTLPLAICAATIRALLTKKD